jgi:hypothetical protein
MNEKLRTFILILLLAIGLFALWLINNEVDTNFINQF